MTSALKSPVPSLDSEQLRAALEEIAVDAARRRDRGGARPEQALAIVRRLRLGALRLPVDDGGGGCSLRELFTFVVRLAQADPEVPHILRGHYGFVEQRLRDGDAERDRPWLTEVAAGRLFGGANAELSGRPGVYTFDTVLRRVGDGFRLDGRKFYSTGSSFVDRIVISANDEAGEQVSVLIPSDRSGVVHVDDWDGIGQRWTGSGTTLLEDVRVSVDEVLPYRAPGGSSRARGAYSQLILHAIAAGILHAVARDAAEVVRGRGRTYSWATAEEPRRDPQLLQVVGELAAAAFVVQAAVLAAADAQDVAFAHVGRTGQADPELEAHASLLAAQVKVGVEEQALRAATELFTVGGASSVRAATHLDRHWRNLRTLFSHNPAVYKARAVGDLVVNGTPLPAVGFF